MKLQLEVSGVNASGPARTAPWRRRAARSFQAHRALKLAGLGLFLAAAKERRQPAEPRMRNTRGRAGFTKRNGHDRAAATPGR